MAFPTTTLLDDFTRADQIPPGADWSTVQVQGGSSNLRVLSNQLAATSAFDNSYLLTLYGADSELYCDIPTLPTAGSYIALFARLQQEGTAGFDGYAVVIIQGAPWTWSIRRYDNGAGTVLGTNVSGPNLTAGDAVGFEVIGSTVAAYHKTGGTWSQVGSRSDATYSTAGKLGVELGDTTQRVDNLSGGTVVAASSGGGRMLLLGVGD